MRLTQWARRRISPTQRPQGRPVSLGAARAPGPLARCRNLHAVRLDAPFATSPRAGRSPTITPVGFGKWLRGIFSSGEFDDEAALREEYNLPERSEDEFQRDRLNSFTGAGESTAEEELDDHQPPPDPA